MYKIKLLTPFWVDGKTSDRERNVFYSWEQTKKLNVFLNENGVKSECRLYDFSPEKTHPESIHIPFELSVFEKSKKINLMIDDNDDCEYVMFIDSDMFFVESDFQRILNILNNINVNDIHTFDCAKLSEEDSVTFINNPDIDIFNFNWHFAYSGDKSKGPLYHSIGGLGVVFIINKNILNTYGRFNEEFKTWGGEDGDAISKILVNYRSINVIPTRDFHPFHLYHFTDWGNIKYKN
jgi:hypothetical protein